MSSFHKLSQTVPQVFVSIDKLEQANPKQFDFISYFVIGIAY